MVKLRRLTRLARRTTFHCLGRRLDRGCLRPARRSGPDNLSQALTAFSRAIQCHRRFARLAPEFFDATTVDRAARRREEQRRWMALWEPALRKVYGPDVAGDSGPDPLVDLPRLPGPRTQRAVERELAGWEFWMAAGRAAMEKHSLRTPHALPSFHQLARLLSIAFDFGRLACGNAAADPPSDYSDHSQAWADLERAYGNGARRTSPPSSPSPHFESETPAAETNIPAPSIPQPVAQPVPPPWPPPDDKRDLRPHALVTGPHGLLCLQPLLENTT